MRSTFTLVLGLFGGAKVASAQGTAVQIKLRLAENVIVRAFAPDSGRFALDGDPPMSRRDTLLLKDGAVLSYDRSSGALRFLVSGIRDGQSVDITGTGERKSRWAVFTTHDVSIDARGPVYVAPAPQLAANAAAPKR